MCVASSSFLKGYSRRLLDFHFGWYINQSLFAHKFGRFILATYIRCDNFKNHEGITLNNDEDIAGTQIPLMWQLICIAIPPAKSSSSAVNVCMPSSFAHCLELLENEF